MKITCGVIVKWSIWSFELRIVLKLKCIIGALSQFTYSRRPLILNFPLHSGNVFTSQVQKYMKRNRIKKNNSGHMSILSNYSVYISWQSLHLPHKPKAAFRLWWAISGKNTAITGDDEDVSSEQSVVRTQRQGIIETDWDGARGVSVIYLVRKGNKWLMWCCGCGWMDDWRQEKKNKKDYCICCWWLLLNVHMCAQRWLQGGGRR